MNNNTNSFAQAGDIFPSGSAFCPRGGCRLIDPSSFAEGLDGLPRFATLIASYLSYLIISLSILMVVYAAFVMLIGGDSGRKQGRQIIVNAFIAVIIAVLAFPAVQIVVNLLNTTRIGE